ncbi:solute carrier family 2, facilitated glucose transporter member 5-like [Drosophila teissieri]|uniref:solute carrier family 2, facilitated glucose transporter member 5-like n=1 Tax=Drosophila teissieri TaxID=7243 RepID=UPI001CBA1A30|nr:solute carrier family 2, facilitated glucose transporter member 5-like [Drosophila teissieri]
MQNDKFSPPPLAMQNDKYPPPTGFYPPPAQQGYPQPGHPQPGYPPPGHPQHITPAETYAGGAPPPPPMPPRDPPTRVDPPTGCWQRNQKNKPQSNAVGSAGLIFISGGMNIAWAIGFRGPIYYQSTKHNYIAWFIGAIIGALVTMALTNKVAKKYVLQFASVLVAIGGLIIACTHNNGAGTTAACYLDGIANGLVFAPFMALVGEISVPYMRGRTSASLEQLCFGSGIFIQILYVSYSSPPYYNDFTTENTKGVLSTIFGVLALIIGSFKTIESPVLMLANNDEQAAIDALRRLQKPAVLTEETYELLAEHKRYLAYNKDMSKGESISKALPTFLRLAYLRVLNAMSISSYVANTYAIAIILSNGLAHLNSWYVGFGLCRLLGTLIPSFCMESLGRKKPAVFGLLVSCGLAFAVGSQYNVYAYMSQVSVLIMIFEFFAGLAFSSNSAYLAEAYPMGVKQHFIGFTFVTEIFVFLIINVCDFKFVYAHNYFYAMGAMYLAGFILGVLTLPETRRMTLRGAQEQFSSFVNFRF